MTMPAYDLDVLRQNRDQILKAELGAFLHNIGKFGEEFIKSQLAQAGNTDPTIARYPNTFEFQNIVGIKYKYQSDRYQPKPETTGFLTDTVRNWLEGTSIGLPAPFNDRTDYCLGDFIEYQNYDFYRSANDPKRRLGRWTTTSWLTELLWASHEASAIDKKGGSAQGRQSTLPVHVATVFGHEYPIDTGALKAGREKLLAAVQNGNRNDYLTQARTLMVEAFAETRRPLNDITLWDVSSAVAAFFKAALAKMLLEGKWTGKANLKWRILRIALDGPASYQHVARLPDLLARKEIIDHSLNTVRKLLEEEYPIANEVYRDEFGSAFVVPDLEGDDDQGSVIQGLLSEAIRNAFREPLTGVRPARADASRQVKLEITPNLYVSQPHEKGLGLADELGEPIPPVTAKPETVRQWWQGVKQADVCTVCGVRPQGYSVGPTSRKAKQRRVCVPCEELRDDRCEKWLDELETTIWLDEVADVNGRVALIVGRFGIDKWLKSGGYIESSLVVNPAPSLQFKKLTFARLRRIWDTTARFWEEIEGKVLQELVPASGVRWRIKVQPGPESDDTPARTHVYQLEIRDIGRLAVACADQSGWKFITAENLERLAKYHKTSLSDRMERIQHKQCTILEDKYNDKAGYTRATRIAEGSVTEVEADPIPYRAVIKILADARSFMMLVPAQRADKILDAIKSKYETEIAYVRNRLPIAVGMVFGQAHTPLSTMLDAGRRMMNLPVKEENWILSKTSHDGDHILEFANGIVWKIPRQMADGVTEDDWYAYFLRADSGEAVHVRDLKKHDEVKVTPSRFDFQFLDCAATRFELNYSDAGRKRRYPRPYLLEQSDDLVRVWELLRTGLSTSQIKALQADIGAKRRQWNGDASAALEAFVRDTLATADWKPQQKPSREELNFLTKAGTTGLLEDAAELYMGLLKRKTGVGGDNE